MSFIIALTKSIPVHVDYEGQRLAERIFQVIITVMAVIGFAAGYIVQRFSWTIYSVLFGFVLSCALILPPWPYLRRHPLQWLKSTEVPSSAESKKRKTK
ncbi:unnamed protein product [Soboliphyme baturini]|uniref:Signal peptidase complex subunit 1 n=1 Tax=Soboliphyme baturini TaxID=241478 RepID=A0A183IFN9_9BILA|nr:unnamed protein product [Soboliphyme baturini]